MNGSLFQSMLVAVGGALGAGLRFGLDQWIPQAFGPTAIAVAPTLAANLSGTLLLAIIVGYLRSRGRRPDWLAAGGATGFCGAYTTTSTFAAESFLLAIYDSPLWAAGYVSVSLVFGLLLAALGLAVGGRLGPVHGEERS